MPHGRTRSARGRILVCWWHRARHAHSATMNCFRWKSSPTKYAFFYSSPHAHSPAMAAAHNHTSRGERGRNQTVPHVGERWASKRYQNKNVRVGIRRQLSPKRGEKGTVIRHLRPITKPVVRTWEEYSSNFDSCTSWSLGTHMHVSATAHVNNRSEEITA